MRCLRPCHQFGLLERINVLGTARRDTDEVHARPPEVLETPLRATYIAILIDAAERAREHAHVAALCEQHGVAPPPVDATQFSAQLGSLRFRWERHGEFSAYTVFAPGLSPRPYAEPAAARPIDTPRTPSSATRPTNRSVVPMSTTAPIASAAP